MDLFQLFVLWFVFSASKAGFCHQKEIADVYSSLQYELQMIEVEEKKCLLSINSTSSLNSSHCNAVFDGMMCWSAARAGTVSVQRCPIYMTTLLPNKNASRICLPNGEWYVHPLYNKTWTNLSECFDRNMDDSPFVPRVIKEHVGKIKTLYDVGYSISLVSLVIAVTIMTYFRNLHCQRNTIHVNLFISFILRSVICFIKDVHLIPEQNIATGQNNSFNGQSTGCKIVYGLFYYILCSNCMWIFVEGIYMHSFVQSTKYNVSVKLYKTLLVVGWGFPILFVFPWVLIRIKFENTLCWNTHDVDNGFIWIIRGPITVTVVINFLFFVNIIRVLYTKLSAVNTNIPNRYRKLAKSTLILIPLFGVYHVLFITVPTCMNPVLEVVWMYTEMFFNSFQGFAVSVLFCYMNEEVQRELAKLHTKRTDCGNGRLSNKSFSKSVEHETRLQETPSGNFYISVKDAQTHSHRCQKGANNTETTALTSNAPGSKIVKSRTCNGHHQLHLPEKNTAHKNIAYFSNSIEEGVHMLDH